MEYKKCMKCKREKPFYEFYNGIDGSIDNTCIECTRKELEILNIINKPKEDKL